MIYTVSNLKHPAYLIQYMRENEGYIFSFVTTIKKDAEATLKRYVTYLNDEGITSGFDYNLTPVKIDGFQYYLVTIEKIR